VEILSEIKSLIHPTFPEEVEEKESLMQMSIQAVSKLRVLESMAMMMRRKMDDDENVNVLNRQQIDKMKMAKALKDIKREKKKVTGGLILDFR
jgi:hypothetical protein